MNNENTTIIICCAGMGTRLGIGTSKALISINKKPLIIMLLEQLNEYKDIRIVVGYQAEKVINMVNNYRKDVIYAFNRNYENNGPAASMWKGLVGAKENVIIIDGDVIVNPHYFKKFLEYPKECVAFSCIKSEEPIYLNIINKKVVHFSLKKTKYIYPGIIKIKKENINSGSNYIYETIEKSLPIEAIEVPSLGIDTQEDYEKAIRWINNNYCEEK